MIRRASVTFEVSRFYIVVRKEMDIVSSRDRRIFRLLSLEHAFAVQHDQPKVLTMGRVNQTYGGTCSMDYYYVLVGLKGA